MIHHDLFHRRLDDAEAAVRGVRENFKANKAKWEHFGMAAYFIGLVRKDIGSKDVWKRKVHVLMTGEPFTRSVNAIEAQIAEAVAAMRAAGLTARRYWLLRPGCWSHYIEVEI